MKKNKSLIMLFFITIMLLVAGNKIEAQETATAVSEFDQLVGHFETNNNFINGEVGSLLVSAEEVKNNIKNDKYLVLDIRSDSWFEYAHIKNAKNVKAAELLDLFKTEINAADYDKIVMVCYSGQSAAYFAGLLRLAGYDNVYSMNFGMSSWRMDFAENAWLKNSKNDYAKKLETTENARPEQGATPELKTGKTTAPEILEARLADAITKPYKDFIIKPEDVFANPGDYFVVSFGNEEQYKNGHIPGAILYGPGCFSSEKGLATLPTDKKIALYGLTGQQTAYLVAYLNLLGYDVGNIAYGANGFMNDTLKDKDWNAFTKKQVNTYPVVE